MRGAPAWNKGFQGNDRIIPADAGSTGRDHGAGVATRDHPRGCGEHILTCLFRRIGSGSSPRMRGARFSIIASMGVLGIIPADAGSTIRHTAPTTRRRDHPRGCGEHSSISDRKWRHGGSSPRMRGALNGEQLPKETRRIIPADAGSTLRNPCNPNNIIDKISNF